MGSTHGRSVLELVHDGVDRLAASDPGLNRLRQATRTAVAMGSTLAVEWTFAGSVGPGSSDVLIAMLLGAVVAMLGSMALSAGTVVERTKTAVLLPASMAVGMVPGTAVVGHTDLSLCVFVVVLFVAVYVRRFGQRFFFAGFLVWMGYFFASFLGASFGQLPWLVLYTVVAAAWVLLLSLTVLKENPARTLRYMMQAFSTRAEAVTEAAASFLSNRTDRSWRRLARRQQQLDQSALMIEGQLGEDGAVLAGWSAVALRRELVDAQLTIEAIVQAVGDLASAKPVPELLDATAAMLRGLPSRGCAAPVAAIDHLIADTGSTNKPRREDNQVRHAVLRLVASIDGYDARVRGWRAREASGPEPPEASGAFASSITLSMGQLPSSAAVAGDVPARSASWNRLARLPLTTRQAIQVALAGGLAIAAGRALSEQRYYWAVIAAFIAFTGTSTAAETFVKAGNRVLGTAAGLGAAIVLANLTAGHPTAVIAVILASVFCGFYLRQISYAFMIFFITILVAQLYSVLHEFTDQLLVLRLEETAIGAGIGVGVALLVIPLSARDTSRTAAANFFTGLQDLLATAAADLDTRPTASPDPALEAVQAGEHRADDDDSQDLDGLSRTLDGHLHQLRQVLQPLTTPLALRADPNQIRHRLALYALASVTARALASAVRRVPGPAPALAEVCRSLARAAGLLADRQKSQPAPTTIEDYLHEAQRLMDATHDTSPVDQPDFEQLTRALARLLHTMRELAKGSPSKTVRKNQSHADPTTDNFRPLD